MEDKEFLVEKIRSQYIEQNTELDELKALDAKVRKPAILFGYTYGSVGAVVMGAGMSFVMTDIAEQIGLGIDPMLPGILVGIVGMFMAIINYPIYKGILGARRKKYANKIIALSDKIMKG